MKRAVWSLLSTLLLFAAPALATTTTVTGTIVDPNGNPYANGTVGAALSVATGQQPTTPGGLVVTNYGPGALDATGHFSIVLTDTSTITPAGSTYQFTICALSVNLGPAATRLQTCFVSGQLSIAGASVDLSTTLNPIARILGPSAGMGQPPGGVMGNIQVNGGGGTFAPLGSSSQCPAGNAPTGIDANGNALNCTGLTLTGDVRADTYAGLKPATWVRDAVLTMGNGTVTSATANFTAAFNNWAPYTVIGFCTLNHSGILAIARSTVTYVNNTTVTMSGSAGASNTGVYCAFGPSADTSLNNSWAAYMAQISAGIYGRYLLPTAYLMVEAAHFNDTRTALSATSGMALISDSFTILIPTPSFSFASCTGGGSGKICFFGNTGATDEQQPAFDHIEGLWVWGMDYHPNAGSGKYIFGFGQTTVDRSGGWGWGDADSSGFQFALFGGVTYVRQFSAYQVGIVPCEFSGGSPDIELNLFTFSYCWGTGAGANIDAGGSLSSSHSYFYQTASGGPGYAVQNTGGGWKSDSDVVDGARTDGLSVYVISGGIAKIQHAVVTGPGTTLGLVYADATSTIEISDSHVVNGTISLQAVAGGQLINRGGNILSGTTKGNVFPDFPRTVTSGTGFPALPSAANSPGQTFLVIDGTSITDCATGGGTAWSHCVSNGTAWVNY